jgi:hypothetical protein
MIGAGLGRTGTMSLKLALEELVGGSAMRLPADGTVGGPTGRRSRDLTKRRAL